jgi:hypothetical protein
MVKYPQGTESSTILFQEPLLQKLLYTVNRIKMSPTPTLNIYLFEGPIVNCVTVFCTLNNVYPA